MASPPPRPSAFRVIADGANGLRALTALMQMDDNVPRIAASGAGAGQCISAAPCSVRPPISNSWWNKKNSRLTVSWLLYCPRQTGTVTTAVMAASPAPGTAPTTTTTTRASDTAEELKSAWLRITSHGESADFVAACNTIHALCTGVTKAHTDLQTRFISTCADVLTEALQSPRPAVVAAAASALSGLVGGEVSADHAHSDHVRTLLRLPVTAALDSALKSHETDIHVLPAVFSVIRGLAIVAPDAVGERDQGP